MTKKERNVLQNLFNRFGEINERKDNKFRKLQELSRENGLPVYCSARLNMYQLQKIDDIKIATEAMELYIDYVSLEGEHVMIHELGKALASVDFWK